MKRIVLMLVVSVLVAAQAIAVTRAVVFDFGGVMTGKSNRQAVVDFLRDSLHLSESEFERAHQEKRAALKNGITDEAFWHAYAKAHGISLPADWDASFDAVRKVAIAADPDMYLLVEELRGRGMRVALLSNVDPHLGQLVRRFGMYKPFDPCLLSHEVGMEKPDPRIYELLLGRLALPAEEVVFIDDKPENVEAARRAKIDAIPFTSEVALRGELSKRGVL